MGTLRFFEEVVSFKIRRTFGFADYTKRLRIFPKTFCILLSPEAKQAVRPVSDAPYSTNRPQPENKPGVR